MPERTILHVDMDAFFAAVEQHDQPELRGKPVVVGARPDERGVVAAASYEARKYGIHSAMPSSEAGRRCPHAIFVPPNGRRYGEVSREVFAIFRRYTPLVEGLSIDEAFLDVTGSRRLFGTGREIARRLKADIQSETGLTASAGVAPNKFLAKLASELDKPDGLTEVPFERDAIVAFLAPLPVGRIWGVGKVTRSEFEQAGIRTIGDLQARSEKSLAELVGKHAARHLHRLALGFDDREIEVEHREKSMSREHTFARDCKSPGTLREILADLVEDVGRRLREDGRMAGVAHLKLRWKGFKTITRQRPLERPCCDDFTLRAVAVEMLEAEPLVRPVRLVGFGVSHLRESADEQLSLFDDSLPGKSRRETLSRAVDHIRRSYGRAVIGRGGSLPPPGTGHPPRNAQ